MIRNDHGEDREDACHEILRREAGKAFARYARRRFAAGGMRAAAFQLFGNFAELRRKFEQCLPRVELRGLFCQLQTFFGMLPAFFWGRHDSDPNWATLRPAVSFH